MKTYVMVQKTLNKQKMKTPNNWITCKLQEVCSTTSGGTPSRRHSEYYKGSIPWIKSGELNDSIILNSKEHISEDAIKNSNAKLFPVGSLLIALYGATIGKMAFLGVPATTNQAICCIFKNSGVNLNFLFYFLLLNRTNLINQGKGGAQKNISQNLLKDLIIPVPPMAEQKRIVKKIEELFGVIDEQVKRLEATHAALVSYRQSVLADCLRKAAGVSTTLGKTVKPRRERVTFNGTNGNMIFIGMDCIESNALKPHKTDLLRNTKSTCFIFHKDDVLYGRMRSYLNKVFKAETNGAASAEFIVFPPTKDILPDYLKYLLHQQDFVSFATRNASGDRPRVKFEEDLAPFPFTLPSLPEQKAIVKKIENAFAFADKAQAAIIGALEQAKQLKQSILKRAFEGKLVPQDPNDKPVDLTQIKKDKHK